MASLGELNVTIGANTREFNAAMNNARGQVTRLGRSMRSGINTAGKYGAAVTAAGAAIATHLVTQSLQAAQEIKNLSQVANEGVESFQRQAFAVQTVGVEQEKYADILKDVQDRVGDFMATGAGPMADFFEKVAPQVGVTAKEFQGLSGGQALQKFVSVMDEANLSTEQMTFHMEALASDSSKLLPLLQNGAAGMDRLTGEARDLNIALSEIDIRQMQAAQESIQKAEAAFGAAVRNITADLAPFIEAMAEAFADATTEAQSFGETAVANLSAILTPVKWVADGIQGIRVIVKGLELAFAGFNAFVAQMMKKVGQAVTGTIKRTLDDLNSLIEGINNVPGIDIPKVDTSAIEGAHKFLSDFAAAQVENVEKTKDELHDLMMEPLPSQMIDRTIEDIKKRAAEARKAMEEAAGSTSASGGRDTDRGEAATAATESEGRTIDTKPFQRAQTVLQDLQRQAGNFPELEFDTDAKALEDAQTLIEALQSAGVDLGEVGVETDDAKQALETIQRLQQQRLDPKSVTVDSQQAREAQSLLERLSPEQEIAATLTVDTSDVERAQGLMDRLAETAIAPQHLEIEASQARSARRAIENLQGIDLDRYKLGVNTEQVTAAIRSLRAIEIGDKTVDVDGSAIEAAFGAVEKLQDSRVGLKEVGVDADQVRGALELLQSASRQQISAKAIPVDTQAIEQAQTALSEIGEEYEILATIDVDDADLRDAQALLAQVSESQISGKRLDVSTQQIVRARKVLSSLAEVDLAEYGLSVDTARIGVAEQQLARLQTQQIAPKKLVVDTSSLSTLTDSLRGIDRARLSPTVRVETENAIAALNEISKVTVSGKQVTVEKEQIEAASEALQALDGFDLEGQRLGVDASQVGAARNALKTLSEARIGTVAVPVDSHAVEDARTALAQLDAQEVSARIDVDTEDVELAQSMLDRLAAVEFDPKRVDINADRARRAVDVMRRLQNVRLSEYDVNIRDAQLKSAAATFEALAQGDIPSKRVPVDDAEIKQAFNTLKQLQSGVQGMQVPEGVGGQVELQKQRQAEAARHKEQIQNRLDRIKNRLSTEKELEVADHERRMEFLRSAEQSELELSADFNKLKEKEKERHNKKMNEMVQVGAFKNFETQAKMEQQLVDLRKASGSQQFNIVAGTLQDIVSSTSQNSKKAFEISKMLSLATATVKGYEAATSAWAAGMSQGGPYLAAAYTAASIAKTAAQISAIQSQTFSGGGSSAPAGGAGASSAPAQPATPVSDVRRNQGQAVNVTIQGSEQSSFSRKQVRDLIDQIKDASDDGAQIQVTG